MESMGKKGPATPATASVSRAAMTAVVLRPIRSVMVTTLSSTVGQRELRLPETHVHEVLLRVEVQQ